MSKRFNLVDPYGRPINSLRISVTQKCNFNCFFCHQEGEHNPKKEMTTEEIEIIVSTAVKLGIRKIKLTGGEPLMRKDLVDIVGRISPLVDEVSMTTNAYFLTKKAMALKKAGLDRVNVSFHSASHNTFKKITGFDKITEVKKGIAAAIKADLNPVKINTVVIKDVNSQEIPDLIKFSNKLGALLQLIEYQPLERGTNNWYNLHYDLKELESKFKVFSTKIIERDLHKRKKYYLKNGGIIEVVRPIHNSRFCDFCYRLRLTSDGCLKPCLMRDDNLIDVASIIRNNGKPEEILQAFKDAISRREPFWKN